MCIQWIYWNVLMFAAGFFIPIHLVLNVRAYDLCTFIHNDSKSIYIYILLEYNYYSKVTRVRVVYQCDPRPNDITWCWFSAVIRKWNVPVNCGKRKLGCRSKAWKYTLITPPMQLPRGHHWLFVPIRCRHVVLLHDKAGKLKCLVKRLKSRVFS